MNIKFKAAAGAAASAMLLAACAGDSTDTEAPSDPNGQGEQQADASTNGASGDHVDTLFADSLHEGIEPAAAGTAYIELAGQRFEFEEITCGIQEDPDAQRFRVDGHGDTEGAGHLFYMVREIGDDIGWNWEDEYVQFAMAIPPADEDSSAMWHSSMIQHEREQGGSPDWDHGSGASPVVRVVGEQATATGTMSALPFHDQALEGDFIAAATCP